MIPYLCECEQDDWCKRYGREMAGRWREICAGINCDLGTAAAFREQWRQESPTQNYDDPPIPLLLKTDQAPGDTVVMTAAIYSLHTVHPGKFLTWVDSPHPEVFQYNPHVMTSPCPKEALHLQMHYPAIHQSNSRGIHFMQAWCEHLSNALGMNVPLLTNRPHLYFDPHWQEPDVGGFWLVCSGGKGDFTCKKWGHENYQQVVSFLKGKVRFFQVGLDKEHHKPLVDTICQVGKTNLRQLFEQVRRARGVLCGVSLLMHVAAALNKPCVVIAGGREPVQWNAYPKQHYLHTVGSLPCRDPKGREGGCWRSRVVPLGDNDVLDRDPCLRPLELIHNGESSMRPECMTLISTEQVADTILKIDKQYEEDGSIQ